MPKIIGPYESGFVQGMSISDNVITVQEILHAMKLCRGKKGYIAVKIDLEKANDRLRWKFLHETLYLAGLPNSLVVLIMQCVSSTS